ncbi:MAG: hypothetical protein IJ636_04860 [Bacteroidales bacterium]|nr:hypothetical protein [Bacteroidales bacterium]
MSDAEIDLTVYPRDSSAAAVLLYRNYTVRIGISATAQLNRTVWVHDRWKILKEAGKDVADYEIVYSTNLEDREVVSGIKVTTFNRGADGKVQQTKMSKKSQFNKKYADNLNKISFAAEDIREGSVVEVSFEVQSPTITIPDIYLQRSDYPVNKIDVEVTYADYFTYNRVTRGFLSADFRQKIENETIATPATGLLSFGMYHDYFTAVDVPVMKDEPYCYCPEQFMLSVCYDLRSVSIPGVLTQDFNAGWTDVDRRFAESGLLTQFKQKYRDADALKALVSGKETADEKIVAVWQYILKQVKWNQEIQLLPQDNKQTLKEGTGSSADMNALMASALNSAGLVAEPVLVKSRKSGALLDFHISSSEFTTFILRIQAPDGTVRYLDASRKDSFLDVLPPVYLVTRGRLLHLDGHGEWVDLTAIPVTNALTQVVRLSLLPQEGLAKGSAEISASNQVAYAVKSHYRSFDTPEAWIEDTENDEGIEVIGMSLDEPDKLGNVAHVTYTFEKPVDLAGDYLYIRPFLSAWHDAQAFRNEKRKLPVEFPYKERINYMCLVEIPEGYAVDQLPATTRGSMPAAGGSAYLIQCQQVGSHIQLSFRADMNVLLLQENDYPDFREFWEHLCKTEESVIVLKKQ